MVPLSDGFETGNFSTWPWQLSSAGASPANWTVETRAWSMRAVSPRNRERSARSSSSTLERHAHGVGRRTLLLAEDVLGHRQRQSDLRDRRRARQLQLSGAVPWQQSFFWVSAGQHTFSWIYGKDAGTPAGNDAAWLDDVQFTPGTTLTVDGTSGNDQFSFDASGASVVVALNGEIHSFAAGEFTNYVFHGDGGSERPP